MPPIFFVMAILGCGDGSTDCTIARIDQARYATMAECRAQLAAGLARHTDLPYPVIAADCRRSAPMVIAGARTADPRG